VTEKEGLMRFEKKGDCYLDTKTGLEWSLESYGPLPWDKIPDLCRDLGNGWRCPTIEELVTLVDYGRYYPATELPKTKSMFYWSSSTYAGYPAYAWYVYFFYGNVGSSAKTYYDYVRCVRSSSTIGDKP